MKIVVNNIKTIIVWAKEHPRLAVPAGLTIALAVIGIIRFILLDIPQILNNVEMHIERDNIYLTQFETGRELIPLNIDGQEAPSIKPIKTDEQVTLRYAIVQDNKNAPQITAIIITFPDDAKVIPDSWRGLTWERNNDVANRYGLSISPFEVLAKGSPYTLPALHVTFKQIGVISFSYQINVNKMDPIRRRFAINTAKNYEDELNKKKSYWTNEVNPETYRTSFFKHGDDRQSVSPSSCLQTYPAASAPTISADSQVQN